MKAWKLKGKTKRIALTDAQTEKENAKSMNVRERKEGKGKVEGENEPSRETKIV